MQAIAEADWQFKRTIIGNQHENVAGGIQHRGAVAAVREMGLNRLAHAGIYGAFDVVRDFAPNVFAV
jgi:hypothetical protein